jgi:DMSO/TMAO reductase YedYZ molybdopterin-dependent catalytic subunit
VSTVETLAIVYDLRDPGAWRAARRHRRLWGQLYTDIHALDADHIALVFRSGGDRWQRWESVRLRRILDQRQESEAA